MAIESKWSVAIAVGSEATRSMCHFFDAVFNEIDEDMARAICGIDKDITRE